MNTTPEFGHGVLDIDCAAETERIADVLRRYLGDFRRKGFVVALSGGIDSSVTAALCVRAVGPGRVFGLHMPERASAPDTLRLSRAVSDTFGFDSTVEEIADTLEAVGCYRRYDDAVRRVVPEYGPGWRSKIVLPSVTAGRHPAHLLRSWWRTPTGSAAATGCPPRPTSGCWPPRTSSSACARCWSTTTPTGSTTRPRAPRTGWSTTRASS